MSDNTVLNLGAGGDTSRAIDKAGVKTQVVTLDLGGSGVESLVAGTVPVSGTVAVSGTVPVSGAFFQATQPVSIASMPSTPVTGPLTDTQLRAAAVPVSGTVSTGLSQPLTDTQLRAVAVPVSGTFFQATQPVSAAALPLPAGAATETTAAAINATLTAGTVQLAAGSAVGATPSVRGLQVVGSDYGGTPLARVPKVDSSGFQYIGNFPATQAVSGTFWQATQPVSLATNTPTLAAGSAIVGKVGIDQTTPGTTNLVSIGTSGTVGITNAAAVAKGTQGANAIPTQDLKDSGRVAISFTAEFSPAAVAETMLTMSVSKDGATATTGSSYVITSGKRLRICSKSIGVENTLGTSIQRAYLRTRFAATGGALVASPLQANIAAAAAGTVKSMASNFDDYPDGMEFLGDGTRAIGWSLQAPDWVTASATLKVYVTVIGYEY